MIQHDRPAKVSRGKRPVLPDSLPAELLSTYKSILDHHTYQGCLYLKGIPSSSSQNVKIIEIHRLCILTSAVHHYPMDGSMVCIVTKLIVPTMAGEYAKLFGFVKYTQTIPDTQSMVHGNRTYIFHLNYPHDCKEWSAQTQEFPSMT